MLEPVTTLEFLLFFLLIQIEVENEIIQNHDLFFENSLGWRLDFFLFLNLTTFDLSLREDFQTVVTAAIDD